MRHPDVRMSVLAVLLVLSVLIGIGCSSGGTKLPDAMPVEGKVARADGTPVGDVLLMLQPTASGHMTSFEVAADGTFSGEAIAGPYAWFLVKSAKANDADKALAKVAVEYQQGSLDRRVTVGSSALSITLP